jgi:TATA-binding protein-associated factor Taf7
VESSSIAPTAWQYGVLGVVALVFGYAIIHLFKALRADQASIRASDAAREKERSDWAVERESWATERESIRADYEHKHLQLAETYARIARDERAENRTHEDLVRKEFAELMEQVSSEASKSSAALVDMLQKFYDRLVGPRRR